MAVQLILYPQQYSGYHQLPSNVASGTTTTGSGSSTGIAVGPTSTLPSTTIPNLVADGKFVNGITNTSISTSFSSGVKDKLTNSPTPIGAWEGYSEAGNGSFVVKSGFISQTNTSGSAKRASLTTNVNGLQKGVLYRLVIDIKSSTATNARLSLGSDNKEWTEASPKSRTSGQMSHLGRLGKVDGFFNVDTGQAIRNPLSSPISTQMRVGINFTSEAPVENLMVNIESDGGQVNINQVGVYVSPDINVATNAGNSGPIISSGGPIVSQPLVSTYLVDGQVICDLYKDQSIPLNLSIDNFKNVDEKIASYSKSFMLPNTKRNNVIFSHYFDVTRTQNHDPYVFNAYAKTRAKIKDDGILIFEGWMKLINVQEKDGQVSYNVNLYSEPTTFCDYLKKRKLSDLNLDELAHDYDFDNITDSWTSAWNPGIQLHNPLAPNSPAIISDFAYNSGITDRTYVIKYPMVNWMGMYQVADFTAIGPPAYPSLGFISFGLESLFRPWVSAKYLLDKMFNDTPFTYESQFLDSAKFRKLFMDFNWGGESSTMNNEWDFEYEVEDTPESTSNLDWKTINFPMVVNESTAGIAYEYFDNTTGVLEANSDNINFIIKAQSIKFKRSHFDGDGSWRVLVTPVSGAPYVAEQDPIDWFDSAQAFHATLGSVAIVGSGYPERFQCGRVWESAYVNGLMTGDKLEIQFAKTSGTGTIEVSKNDGNFNWVVGSSSIDCDFCGDQNTGKSVVKMSVTGGTTGITTMMKGKRGTMGQYEFWKGLKDMFNLITMQSDKRPNHLIIEPYNDVFLNNPDTRLHDWTNKIDESNIKHAPLNKIPAVSIFNYKHDKSDYRLQKYKEALGGYEYGEKTYEAGSTFFSLLSGTKKLTNKTFSPTVCAHISPLFTDYIIPNIYKTDEGQYKAFDNQPRILWDNGLKFALNNNYICIIFGVQTFFGFTFTPAQNAYLQFSHTEHTPTVPYSHDLNYGECPLVSTMGPTPTDNLFNVYWKPYYDELYNPDTRELKLKIALNPQDIEDFNFYDYVQIKSRRYRVNKIQYASGELSKVELILLT